MKTKNLSEKQTMGEEIANAAAHGIGVFLSLAALVILVVFASTKGDVWRIVSFGVYGFTLVFLYTMSLFSHALTNPKAKNVFEILDHAGVYLLIAGTYTPVALVFLRGAFGWVVFGVIWGLAVCGILFKVFFTGKFRILSLVLYIFMGWLIVFALKPIADAGSMGFIFWIAAGGISYTLGTVFFMAKKMPYHHFVWHLFVLAGSTCHFLGFLFYGFG
ncbi:MAG TPA: hemolysin III family protein [Firmicutes bacterium]|nr:hemolysin III family protein [Bacillota bacterium]